MLVGPTRAGKSTMANKIADIDLEYKETENRYEVEDNCSKSFIIGDELTSCTSIPNLLHIEDGDYYILDNAGIEDTTPHKDFMHYYSMVDIIKNSE